MELIRDFSQSFALGVNDSTSPQDYNPHEVQVLINGRPSLHGGAIETLLEPLVIGGQEPALTADMCWGAIEFYTAAGVQQLIAAFDTSMYFSTDGGATWTVITSATSLREDYWSFVIIREGAANVLCCANGGSASYQYDGTTWATISNIPSGTKYLAVHGNRLIAAGGSGVTVAASAVGNIDVGYVLPQGWAIQASTNDGDTEVMGLFTLGSVVMVFKRKSVGFIEGFGFTTLQVETGARGLSRSVGCVGFRTIAALGDQGVMWLSERGFEAYSFGGRVTLVSERQQRFVDGISFGLIRRYPGMPVGVWWPKKQEYICAVPVYMGDEYGADSTYNNWMYCYRPGTEGRPPAAYMRHPVPGANNDVGFHVLSSVEEAPLTDTFASATPWTLEDGWEITGGNLVGTAIAADGALASIPVDITYNVLYRITIVVSALSGGNLGLSLGFGPQPAAAITTTGTHEIIIPAGGTDQLLYFMGVSGTINCTIASILIEAIQGDGELDITNLDYLLAKLTPDGELDLTFLPDPGDWVNTLNGELTTWSASIGQGNGEAAPYTALFTANRGLAHGQLLGIHPLAPFFSNMYVVQFDPEPDSVHMFEFLWPGIVRTRPLTFGDQFTLKRGARVTVVASQREDVEGTAYLVADEDYSAGHALDFVGTIGGGPIERTARVGGRGRTLHGEYWFTGGQIITGIEVAVAPKRERS